MKKVFIIAAIGILFTGCHIYKKYESTENVPDNLFGKNSAVTEADTSKSIADLSWQEIFNDPYLKRLIDSALAHNNNVLQSHYKVQEMEAALKAAKLAYIPSFTFAPNAGFDYTNGFNKNGIGANSAFSYSVGIQAQWQIDIFGRLTNIKRQTNALTEQARDYEQAARVELISSMANMYYLLLMADRDLEIIEETEVIWRKGVETQRALMEAGMSNSVAVNQLEASLYDVEVQKIDLINLINTYENSICLLLSEAPHHINRGELSNFTMPAQISIGIPVSMLHNRPDVRAAQHEVEAAYYATCKAYSDMYPNITLSGNLALLNPVQLGASVLAQLVQPIFAQGSLRANLKISKAQQEEAKLAFSQKVLNAGVEVNEALADCQSAKVKKEILSKRVDALTEAYEATSELMNKGTTTYLEVLIAQETLLSAQLSQVNNDYDAVNSLIKLYVALGGGSK